MGTKGAGRRSKTRFHSGAKLGHFKGPTRGKRVRRGNQEERGKRKALRRLQQAERNAENQKLELLARKRRQSWDKLPPLPQTT